MRRQTKRFNTMGSRSDRIGHTGKCLTCGQTVIVIRNAADALLSVKDMGSRTVRLLPIHLKDAGPDFVEAATTKSEFNHFLSSIICEQPKRKPWEAVAA